MPQATLLDFFKSQTLGVFTPVASSAETPLTDDEPEVQPGELTGVQTRQQDTQSAYQQAISRSLRQVPSPTALDAPGTNGTSSECHPKGLVVISVQTVHLPALKRLTGNLLPVRYPEKFFDGAVNEIIPATFSRVALIDGKPVGWIRCRLDPFPEPTAPPSETKPIYNRIYVQALCLLAPYRGLGIATSLLNAITAPQLVRFHDIDHVYAHVWENNEEALEWYDRRGFQKVMNVEQYYRKLRPDGAWIVKKSLGSM